MDASSRFSGAFIRVLPSLLYCIPFGWCAPMITATQRSSKMRSKLLCAAASLLLFASHVTAAARIYDSIFSFGDSYADTGNNAVVFPANSRFLHVNRPPYGSTFFGHPTGRCSNGRLVIDFIAQALGLPLVPPYLTYTGSFRRGANFAVSGATTFDTAFFEEEFPGSSWFPLNDSLGVQLQWFESLKPSLCGTTQECEDFLGRSLFVVGVFGINDYHFYDDHKSMEEIFLFVPQIISTISKAIERLISHGAKSLVIPGMVPLGCVTKVHTDGCLEEYNKLGLYHNLLLQDALKKLQAKHPNTTIIYGDLYGPIMEMVESPTKFGFDEDDVLTACCGGPGTLLCGDDGAYLCQNPSTRLLWDAVHPTERAYHYIAYCWMRDIDDSVASGSAYTT